jgi:hypothetical protein
MQTHLNNKENTSRAPGVKKQARGQQKHGARVGANILTILAAGLIPNRPLKLSAIQT